MKALDWDEGRSTDAALRFGALRIRVSPLVPRDKLVIINNGEVIMSAMDSAALRRGLLVHNFWRAMERRLAAIDREAWGTWARARGGGGE